jgi:formylglycine-generating enzyme required for sulfatase activity
MSASANRAHGARSTSLDMQAPWPKAPSARVPGPPVLPRAPVPSAFEHVHPQPEPPVPVPADYEFDLFVVHAAADAGFVREYLLPALALPRSRVLLIDELPLGGLVVSEIDRGVSRSRYTVAVLSPAYLEDRWADFGEQLASYLSRKDVRVIPLRWIDCELPFRLEARVALDFTDKDRWAWETARLRDLLHSPAPAAARVPYPYLHKRTRRRWMSGLLSGAATGALLMLASVSLWSRRPVLPSPPDDMVRFSAASIRPGVFATGSRPQACSALTASEDCAVLEHPENVGETHVASFDLDRLEVTNEAFAAWLNANVDLWKLTPYSIVTTRHEPAVPLIRTEKCGDGLTITPENRALVTADASRRPAVCVTWYGANEYCRTHGKRLPLDTEWELAAKGAEGRPFPWGTDLPRQDGVAFELRTGASVHPRMAGDSPQDVSPEGVHDLGGNVAEWVEDRRGDPSEKTLRGGSFASMGPCHLLGSGCRHIVADKYQKDIGFRCARSVIAHQTKDGSR